MDIKKHEEAIEALLKENRAEENRTPFLDAVRGSLSNALGNLASHGRELVNRAKLKEKRLQEQREELQRAEAEALKTAEAKASAPAEATDTAN